MKFLNVNLSRVTTHFKGLSLVIGETEKLLKRTNFKRLNSLHYKERGSYS